MTGKFHPFLLACVGAILMAAGCNSAAPRGVVRGKVSIDGKPLTNATVVFENSATGVAATAPVAEGAFEVKMIEGAGLPPGSYKVAVRPGVFMRAGEEVPLAGTKAPPRPTSPSVPEKYLRAGTSGLTAEVKEGENPPFTFELKS